MNSFAAFGNNQMKFSFFLILLYYVNIPCTKRKNLNTKKNKNLSPEYPVLYTKPCVCV